ncbi:MAG: hypothetical protein AB1758_04700 [Candidatus Eremiobacterota bacterium]
MPIRLWPASVRGKGRGSALLLTLFFLMFLHLLALAFITMIPTEMNSATRHKQDATAYYVGNSALNDTIQWLRYQGDNLDAQLQLLQTAVDPAEPAMLSTYYRRSSNQNMPSGWEWQVRIFPDPQTGGYPNLPASTSVRAYKLKILCFYQKPNADPTNLSGLRREITAWIQQRSLAGNTWTINQPPSGTQLWLNLGTFRINGKFHTNGPLMLSIPAGYDWLNVQPSRANCPFQDTASFVQETYFNNLPASNPAAVYRDGIRYIDWSAPRLPYDPANGNDVLTNPLDPNSTNRYDRLSKLGKGGFEDREDPIVMPEISADLAKAAWGSTPPAAAPVSNPSAGNPRIGINVNGSGTIVDSITSSSGTTINVQGNYNGFYIAGQQTRNMNGTGGNLGAGDPRRDVQEMELSTSGQNAVVRIRQVQKDAATPPSVTVPAVGSNPDSKWRSITTTFEDTNLAPGGTFTVNGQTLTGSLTVPKDYTIVQNDVSQKTYEIYKGTGNGLVYVANGDVMELEGVNKGRKTVAVSQADNREVRVTDSLTRADTTPGQAPASGAVRDQLGVIAYAVRFATQRSNPATANVNRSLYTVANPLYLYAAIYAAKPGDTNSGAENAGGIGTIEYDNSAFGAGRLVLYGSMTEGIRQAKGTFNAATGAPVTGFNYTNNEDQNFELIAPPFFPADGDFRVVNVRERSFGG